jgi:hypothetical protein
MFIAALFTIANFVESQDVPTEDWIKKMWNLYMMEFYLAIKKNEICYLQVNEWNWRISP